MDLGYLILFGAFLGIIAFLIWMLYPLNNRARPEEKDKIMGQCPVCGQPLRKGERLRSDITEIGDAEVRTYIKGCPYCMGELGKRKRTCPVCKKKTPMGEAVMALSNPKEDKKRLSIRGCKQCYPQGFD